MNDDIIFQFEHKYDASEFAKHTSCSTVGKLNPHNVHISKPSNMRHVRSYLGQNKCGFVFDHEKDANAFYEEIHYKGDKEYRNGTWRVYVPSKPQ